MATPIPNPAQRPPDEAELLAWVEGERLPRDRELAVAAALAADPALARKMELMRADLAAMRSLPDVSAPPGLMASVEAALQPVLERQMLLGLQAGEPTDGPIPISVVQPARRSIFHALFAERAGQLSAAAAALLLLVGGTTYFATSYFSGSTRPERLAVRPQPEDKTDSARLALNSEPVAPAPDTPIAAKVGPEPVTIAQADPVPPTSDGGLAEAAAAEAVPETTLADAALFGPPAPIETSIIDIARALDLAREGRLVIRLTTADPAIMAHPDRLAERIRRAASPAWRLGGPVPEAVLAGLDAPRWPAARPVETEAPGPTIMAGGEPLPDLAPDMFGPPRPLPEIPPPGPAAFMVQTRLDLSSLETLRNAIAGAYGEVVFEATDHPMPLGTTPPLNPAAVLWWSQPPAGWSHWADVPVVVDAVR